MLNKINKNLHWYILAASFVKVTVLQLPPVHVSSIVGDFQACFFVVDRGKSNYHSCILWRINGLLFM